MPKLPADPDAIPSSPAPPRYRIRLFPSIRQIPFVPPEFHSHSRQREMVFFMREILEGRIWKIEYGGKWEWEDGIIVGQKIFCPILFVIPTESGGISHLTSPKMRRIYTFQHLPILSFERKKKAARSYLTERLDKTLNQIILQEKSISPTLGSKTILIEEEQENIQSVAVLLSSIHCLS